ncbi:MAG: polysaccharide deacetylase family protein [Clostridiales bacterium]|nr:polysaccharide deacetylase family protein [Clostridiales bacterium]
MSGADISKATGGRRSVKKIAAAFSASLAICAALAFAANAAGFFERAYDAAAIAQTMKTDKKLPIYSVETDEKKIALSFDAAWGADDTDELLKILDEYKAKATFFVCGYWAEDFPEDVKKLAAAGHEIANHGDTHAHVAKLSLEQNKEEIMGAHEKVKDLLGINMVLFRPPFGEYNDTVIEAAEQAGYYATQWSVDSLDWMNKGVTAEISQVLNHKNLGPGAILLFHNNADYTPQALPFILQRLTDDGYAIVTVSDLIIKDNYFIDSEGRQKILE